MLVFAAGVVPGIRTVMVSILAASAVLGPFLVSVFVGTRMVLCRRAYWAEASPRMRRFVRGVHPLPDEVDDAATSQRLSPLVPATTDDA